MDLFAKSYEYVDGKCYVDGILQATTSQCDTAGGWVLGGVLAFFGIILLPLLILALVFFIWWVIMLIHVIKHEDVKDRTVWLIVLIVSFVIGLHWVAAPIYYFAVKRPYDRGEAREVARPVTAQVTPPTEPKK